MKLRHSDVAGGLALVLLFSSVGCVQQHAPILNVGIAHQIIEDEPEMRGLMGELATSPDDRHFRELVAQGKNSSNPLLMTLIDFDKYRWLFLCPIDPPSTPGQKQWPLPDDIDAAAFIRRIKSHPPSDFRLVAATMITVDNPTTQWMMARFLGEFAGQESLPYLKKLTDNHSRDVDEGTARQFVKINERLDGVARGRG